MPSFVYKQRTFEKRWGETRQSCAYVVYCHLGPSLLVTLLVVENFQNEGPLRVRERRYRLLEVVCAYRMKSRKIHSVLVENEIARDQSGSL